MTRHFEPKRARTTAPGDTVHRARSLRFVQIVYAVFTLASVAAALAFAHFAPSLGFTVEHGQPVGFGFLILATVNLLILYVWEVVMRA